MQKLFLLLTFIIFILNESNGQFTKRVVFFTDKNETPYNLKNPSAFLSSRSVERRTKYNITTDSTDLPVITRYINSILKTGTVTLLGKSRWLNAIIIQTNDDNAITKINSFPFVKSLSDVALRRTNSADNDKFQKNKTNNKVNISNRTEQLLTDTFNYGSSVNQIKIHKGEFLHNIGARGQGMLMAFLDAGFFGYLNNPFFDSTRTKNQILATWDFVQNNASVNEDNAHGMQCFSTVASNKPGTFIGSCPEAKYFLLRTEDAPTEQIIEEYNWVLGAEYADSAGVDVISSSLGYSTFDNPAFNHTYADLNGQTTIISQMADMAAKKGMLVVISAGNGGDDPWKYITAPADADSVLTVGSVNSSGIISAFSSYGPTSDGQIKPDVVSVGDGTIISTVNGTIGNGYGTSFSAPNISGLATCLWQLFPEFNNMKMITTLRKASDKFNLPDSQYGYGLPNMKLATGLLLADFSNMIATKNNFTTTLNWNSKDISGMRYEIERKLPGETEYKKIFTLNASGNTFINHNYEYIDIINNSPAGIATYRIQEVIDTSAVSFTSFAIDSASVTLLLATSVNDLGSNSKLVIVYPNPTHNTLVVNFTEQNSFKNLYLQIFNSSGQLVIVKAYNKPTGSATLTLSLNSLPKGNYTLLVTKDSKHYAVKEFIKQ
jgi:serine protease AprX